MGSSPVTKLAQALDGVSQLGFDTAPIIYFVERHPAFIAVVREVFRQVDVGAIAGMTGMVSLAEVLVKPKSLGDAALASAYRGLLFGSRNFSVLPINDDVADQAADLRARYKMKLPDALQIASALVSGCDAFLTNDSTDMKRVQEIRILVLKDLEP